MDKGVKVMRAIIQRVTSGAVDVNGERTGEIQDGLVVLLGVSTKDTETDVNYLAEKIINLRVFEDDQEKMTFHLKMSMVKFYPSLNLHYMEIQGKADGLTLCKRLSQTKHLNYTSNLMIGLDS